ncbi:MAG TPA: histidine kinase [Parafilimonas sp.]|nr:histidine kinase [Parafilimonas sp.]
MKFILILIFVPYSHLAHPQNKTIDSLQHLLHTQKEDTNKVNTLNKLCVAENNNANYSIGLQYGRDALSISEKMNFKKGKASAYYNLACSYGGQNDQLEARKNYSKALELYEAVNDKQGVAESKLWIGHTFTVLEENYSLALKNYYEALKLFEELNDDENLASAYQFIGGTWFSYGNLQEASKFFIATLKVSMRMHDSARIAQAYISISGVYTAQENYTKAIEYLIFGKRLFEAMRHRGPIWGVPFCYTTIGNIYERQGDSAGATGNRELAKNKYTGALNNYFTGLKFWKEINARGDAWSYTSIGNINIKLGNLSIAKSFLEKGLQLSAELSDKEGLNYSYGSLSHLDSMLGNYRQAYEHYKMYILYRDSLVNEENKKKMLQSAMQYHFDKKQDSIKAAQDKKDIITAAEIKDQKLFRNFSFAGIFLIVSFGSYSFYRYRRRRKLQSQQEMLNERLRISRELHDDIGSTLGSISIYSEVAKNRSQKNENADEAISKIGVASRELIDKMSDIVWSINPDNESFEQLQNRMQSFAAMMLTPRDVQNDFIVDEHLKSIPLTTEERKNIFLIFKEAIHNIVKYAECSKVEIRLLAENDNLEMYIKDDGKGFDVNEFRPDGESLGGNGLKNMKARADDIKAFLNIQSERNKGTTIQLTFKT